MTREEIDRHVAGIQALRKRKSRRRGLAHGNDYNPRRPRIYGAGASAGESRVCEVDVMFTSRQRYGWLPRGGDE